MLQMIGIRENAWAMFVESVNSPSIVFMTPTLPFNTPHTQRLENPFQRCASLPSSSIEEIPDNKAPEGSRETESEDGNASA